MSPEIVAPDFSIEVDTRTPMNEGTTSCGDELFPGLVDQLPPQTGGAGLVVSAKPLKLGGASPPLSTFSVAHCAPQNVAGPAARPSPSTNAPRAGKAKMSVVFASAEGR